MKEPCKKNNQPLPHPFINKIYFKFSVTVYIARLNFVSGEYNFIESHTLKA